MTNTEELDARRRKLRQDLHTTLVDWAISAGFEEDPAASVASTIINLIKQAGVYID